MLSIIFPKSMEIFSDFSIIPLCDRLITCMRNLHFTYHGEYVKILTRKEFGIFIAKTRISAKY